MLKEEEREHEMAGESARGSGLAGQVRGEEGGVRGEVDKAVSSRPGDRADK
jgi:hypothetical protein